MTSDPSRERTAKNTRAHGVFTSTALVPMVIARYETVEARLTTQQDITIMTNRAAGTFEVSMKPYSPSEDVSRTSIGRMSLDKQFAGDLIAVGKGEMLTAMTETPGSAGYVAIERVTGTLHGRLGSFVFQHSGTMNRGAPTLSVAVVPDSGTGQLTGIVGTFTLNIVDGKHVYAFDYSLP